MATIKTIVDEAERGCGFRHKGMYLISEGEGRNCGKLPLELSVCPCCGNGIKHSLGWSWVNPKMLFKFSKCAGMLEKENCVCECPLADPPEKAGLIWVGEQFYATPEAFQLEAAKQGISRRIAAVPRGFTVGQDWILLAHKSVVSKDCPNCSGLDEGSELRKTCKLCKGTSKIKVPGIFYMFKPTRIEYVIDGTEDENQLNELERRGFTLVKLVRTDGKGWKPNPGWKRYHNLDGSPFYKLGDYKIESAKGGTVFTCTEPLGHLTGTTSLTAAKKACEEHMVKHA